MSARIFPPLTLKGLVCWALIPVTTCELVLFPFWLARVYMHHSWLPSAQLSITAIILPLYLALLGIAFSWRSSVRETLGGLAVLVVSVALITFLDYSVWGVSTGRFFTPDYETVFIVRTAGEIALVIALAPPLLTLAVRYISQQAHRNA